MRLKYYFPTDTTLSFTAGMGFGKEISVCCYQPRGGRQGPVPALLQGSDLLETKADSLMITVSEGGPGHYSGLSLVLESCSVTRGQLRALGLCPARSRHTKETDTPGRAGGASSLSVLGPQPSGPAVTEPCPNTFLPETGEQLGPCKHHRDPRQLLFFVGLHSMAEMSQGKDTFEPGICHCARHFCFPDTVTWCRAQKTDTFCRTVLSGFSQQSAHCPLVFIISSLEGKLIPLQNRFLICWCFLMGRVSWEETALPCGQPCLPLPIPKHLHS